MRSIEGLQWLNFHVSRFIDFIYVHHNEKNWNEKIVEN